MSRRGHINPMVSSTDTAGGFPGPVYEALPLVYLAVAIALVIMVESPLIFLSSALFGAAGVGVLWMRLRNRRGG
ncbi:hypothetical protein [Thiohalorhabdus sp.]|uniref:hypothetical protein n=1 Tax=Thiohalorhabdus sp. TaxID=3094134 RepID=UPI002FC3BA0D